MSDGKDKLNIDNLNSYDMIKKLFIVEKDPFKIWEAF